MKKLLFILFSALLMPLMTFAQQAGEQGLDDKINEAFAPFAKAVASAVFFAVPIGNGLSIPIVLIILILGAAYFTVYFGFPNFTKFKLAIDVVRGKYDSTKSGPNAIVSSGGDNIVLDDNIATDDGDILDTIKVEGHDGEVTPFQALTAALSATVGLGNIAGVAIAIAVGGPGATLWMILAGFLGMASKFTECTLGVKYREIGPDGTVYGGPMYYLKKGLAERGMAGLGKVFACLLYTSPSPRD